MIVLAAFVTMSIYWAAIVVEAEASKEKLTI
jgi:hypothetical protein